MTAHYCRVPCHALGAGPGCLRSVKGQWEETWEVALPNGKTEVRVLALKYHPPWYRLGAAHRLSADPRFEMAVLLAIVANTVCLTFESPFMSAERKEWLENAELIFSSIFGVEALCKIVGMGLRNYLSTPLNVLDFCIVCLAVISVITDTLGGATAARLVRLFRVGRAMRVARVARLFSMIQRMRDLILTVFGNGRTIGNIILTVLFCVTVN
eukprot:COSAG05_NODE_4840_length_1353_cov_1.622807_1_plen_211_part_10